MYLIQPFYVYGTTQVGTAVLDDLAAALAEGFMTPEEMREALQAVEARDPSPRLLPSLSQCQREPWSPSETERIAKIFQGGRNGS